MEPASTSASPETGEIKFEISEEAAALIRRRGGQAWIWADFHRRLHATTGKPATHKPAWWECPLGDLVVHVDSAIVPPEQWALAAEDGALTARWDGHNPDLFGRVPLAQAEDESAEDPADPTSSPLAHVGTSLVVPALAWVFAVLWALRLLGVGRAWLGFEQAALFAALSVVGVLVWLYEKLAERREDKAVAKELADHFARSRAERGH
jgi:hypothetical protein